jgi:adenylate kinase family enzyme
MKLYIIGSVVSGKTTVAKRLSEATNIRYTMLDEIVHEPDESSVWGNRKRPAKECDRLFSQILQQEKWIIEDVCRPCFSEGLEQADAIVLLELPLRVRIYRIFLRWIKQRFGIERSLYRPSYKMLKRMLGWAKNYDSGKGELLDRIKPYQDKLVILHSQKEIDEFISEAKVKLQIK